MSSPHEHLLAGLDVANERGDVLQRERDDLLTEVREVRAEWGTAVERAAEERRLADKYALLMREADARWARLARELEGLRREREDAWAEAAMLRDALDHAYMELSGIHMTGVTVGASGASAVADVALTANPSVWLAERDAQLRAEVGRQVLMDAADALAKAGPFPTKGSFIPPPDRAAMCAWLREYAKDAANRVESMNKEDK